jgi:hypothetical protein
MEALRKPKRMNFIGNSMNPTLKSGDRLKIIPYDRKRIRRGDVVVFIPPGGATKIIHRVISIDSCRIRTRGDSSSHLDPWVLKPDHIHGRVVWAKRENRQRRVFGGTIGQLFGVTFRAIHSIDVKVSSRLRPVYNRLALTGIFRRWLPARIKPRAISLNHPAGTELQLIMGRCVIGRWLPGKTGWYIRRPFRLFVDEETLPENKTGVSGIGFQVSGGNNDK